VLAAKVCFLFVEVCLLNNQVSLFSLMQTIFLQEFIFLDREKSNSKEFNFLDWRK